MKSAYDKRVRCPYNPNHEMPETRLEWHFRVCQARVYKAHLFATCPYNQLHIVKKEMLDNHLQKCPDNQSKYNHPNNDDIFAQMAKALQEQNQNNEFNQTQQYNHQSDIDQSNSVQISNLGFSNQTVKKKKKRVRNKNNKNQQSKNEFESIIGLMDSDDENDHVDGSYTRQQQAKRETKREDEMLKQFNENKIDLWACTAGQLDIDRDDQQKQKTDGLTLDGKTNFTQIINE